METITEKQSRGWIDRTDRRLLEARSIRGEQNLIWDAHLERQKTQGQSPLSSEEFHKINKFTEEIWTIVCEVDDVIQQHLRIESYTQTDYMCYQGLFSALQTARKLHKTLRGLVLAQLLDHVLALQKDALTAVRIYEQHKKPDLVTSGV